MSQNASESHEAANVEVPRRFLQEVSIALAAASIIGHRDGAHLNYSNQDRLRWEADRLAETSQ